jgi:arsenate reductase
MKNKLKILFLCTGNSCRSQMAEGWAKKLRSDDIEAFSAGVKPKKIDPRAVKAMAEAGVDISGQGSKDVKDLMHVPFDYVITLCGHAHETCPLFPGKTKVIHHGFDDPPRLAATAKTDEEAMMHYRRVRDEIRDFVRGLPDNLKDEGMGFKLNL